MLPSQTITFTPITVDNCQYRMDRDRISFRARGVYALLSTDLRAEWTVDDLLPRTGPRDDTAALSAALHELTYHGYATRTVR